MNGSGMLPDSAELAVAVGRNINSQGRMYTVGAPYSMDLKVEVAHTYILLARQSATGVQNYLELQVSIKLIVVL